MRFSLRTLLIVMLIAGPLCAYGWQKYLAWKERVELQKAADAFDRQAVVVRGGILRFTPNLPEEEVGVIQSSSKVAVERALPD